MAKREKTIEEWTAADFKTEAKRILENSDAEEVRLGTMMLAALKVGTESVSALAAAIGVEPKDIQAGYDNLVRAKVFKGGKVHADWFDEETGGLAFVCDVAVAKGFLQRAPLRTKPSGKVGKAHGKA